MRKLILITVFLFFTSTAQAILIDNLDGTITQIRSDGSMLMWLQDANYAMTSGFDADGLMTWDQANTWASNLTVAGYDDWRLPAILPTNGDEFNYNFSVDGSTDGGYNNTSLNSEMAYLFYVELANKASHSTNNQVQNSSVYGMHNSGPFTNIPYLHGDFGTQQYWYGMETIGQSPETHAWTFHFTTGLQTPDAKFDDNDFAWAVREVREVPEPATILLLIIGLIGIAGIVGIRDFRRL